MKKSVFPPVSIYPPKKRQACAGTSVTGNRPATAGNAVEVRDIRNPPSEESKCLTSVYEIDSADFFAFAKKAYLTLDFKPSSYMLRYFFIFIDLYQFLHLDNRSEHRYEQTVSGADLHPKLLTGRNRALRAYACPLSAARRCWKSPVSKISRAISNIEIRYPHHPVDKLVGVLSLPFHLTDRQRLNERDSFYTLTSRVRRFVPTSTSHCSSVPSAA